MVFYFYLSFWRSQRDYYGFGMGEVIQEVKVEIEYESQYVRANNFLVVCIFEIVKGERDFRFQMKGYSNKGYYGFRDIKF